MQVGASSNGLSINQQISEAKKSVTIGQAKEDQIIKALKYIFAMLGIQKDSLPEGHEIAILINFLKKQFPHTTLRQVVQSFEFGIANKFEIEKSLYGKPFNCEFISNFINGYTSYLSRTKTTRQSCETSMQLNNETKKDAMTPKQWYDKHISMADVLVKFPTLIRTETVLEYIIDNSLIEDIENTTTFARQLVMQDQANEKENAKNLSDLQRIMNEHENRNTFEFLVKRKLVELHLRKILSDGKNNQNRQERP